MILYMDHVNTLEYVERGYAPDTVTTIISDVERQHNKVSVMREALLLFGTYRVHNGAYSALNHM